ncbi:MAG: trypsin-like serine protease [Candidatus Methylumidiphilus sp.]
MNHPHHKSALFDYITLASLLIWAPAGQAIYIRDDVAASNYDALAARPEYAAAGWLWQQGQFGDQFCTGTLVAADKVLTAAHCVFSFGSVEAPQNFAFGLSADLPPSFTNNVSAIAVSSHYDDNNFDNTYYYDLAILTLNNPLAQTPAAVWSNVIASSPTPFTGVMLGYGDQGTGVQSGLVGAAARLAAMNLIDTGGIMGLETDFDKSDGSTNTFGNPYPIALEGTTCYGDSGGPLYIQGGGVVGVLSSGYSNYGDPCLYGDVSQWVSIANPLNLEFLASQGINISDVPEPPTLPMFLPSLLALRLCRRFKAQ